MKENSHNEVASAAAEFQKHKKPITFVKWRPKDASMLCASSEERGVLLGHLDREVWTGNHLWECRN